MVEKVSGLNSAYIFVFIIDKFFENILCACVSTYVTVPKLDNIVTSVQEYILYSSSWYYCLVCLFVFALW